jgi:signal transduction histidine kinase
MKPILIARAQRFLAAAGLLSAAFAVFAYRTSTEHVESVAQTLLTVAFTDKIHALFLSVEDAETAQRGYLLTGKREYLQPFMEARQNLPQRFQQIDAAAGNAASAEELRRLHELISHKMAELQRTVELEEAGNHTAAITRVVTGEGYELMRQIRDLIHSWEQEQHRLFQNRLDAQEFRQRLLNVAWICTILTTFVFLLMVHQLSNRFALERESVERHILDLNRTLETRVRERTLELERSAHELERSNADLTEFAYVASHDLQEPLRMVRSYMGLLVRRHADMLDEQAKTYVQYAMDGAARMQALINDLLQYSRAGTQPLQKQNVSSEELVKTALSNLEVSVAENDAEVHLRNLPFVCADPTKLTQVFQNLVGNAIKFKKDSERPKIEVTAERVGPEWKFSIADNGIGLDMVYKEKIFEIFHRLHGVNEFSGNGIGLSICRRIVEQHDGRLWVDSEPGSGTTFHFTIPISPASAAD